MHFTQKHKFCLFEKGGSTWGLKPDIWLGECHQNVSGGPASVIRLAKMWHVGCSFQNHHYSERKENKKEKQ